MPRAEPTPEGGGRGLGPGGQDRGNGGGGDNGNGGNSGNGSPPGQGDAPSGATEAGLRVVPPADGPGLIESIVGSVAGAFFGA